MGKSKGDFLRLMARSETIKQASKARKLRDAQAEADQVVAQQDAVAKLLKDHANAAPKAQTAAQLTNTLRVGQQLETHRNLLKKQKKSSDIKLRKAKSDLAKTGHKLDILTDKARAADRADDGAAENE